MKIVFVDNMNNNFYAITKYLSDIGFECCVYTLPIEQFPPSPDYINENPNKVELKKFPFQPNLITWVTYETKVFEDLLEDFKSADMLVACGWSMAFFHRVGIEIDLAIPYGDDIDGIITNKDIWAEKFSKEQIDDFIFHQTHALKKSRCIIYQGSCDHLKALQLNYISLCYPRIYAQLRSHKNYRGDMLRIISTTRNLWASQDHVTTSYFQNYGGYKRNDLVIKAFARLTKLHGPEKLRLCISNSGPSFGDTLNLIDDLKILEYIEVLDRLPRHLLFEKISLSDICVDAPQIGFDHSFGGLSDTMESALVGNTPLLARMDNPILRDLGIPILNTSSEQDLYIAMKMLAENSGLRSLIGGAGSKWRFEHVVSPFIDAFSALADGPRGRLNFSLFYKRLSSLETAQIVESKS